MKSILVIEEITMKTIKRNTTHAIERNMMYAIGRNQLHVIKIKCIQSSEICFTRY
jgi:hypothetical protein